MRRKQKQDLEELTHVQIEQVHVLFLLLKHPTHHNVTVYLNQYRALFVSQAINSHRVSDADRIEQAIAKLEERLVRHLNNGAFRVEAIESCVNAFRKYCCVHFRYVCMDIRRSMKRAHQPLSYESQIQDHTRGRMFLARELIQRIGHEIRLLPSQQQTIIRLRYIHGQSNATVARILDVSEPVASKKHKKALMALRERLGTQPELLKLFNQMVG